MDKKLHKLDYKSWVSGFVDGEGCFSISFNKRTRNPLGLEVRPSFSISQNKASLESLSLIKAYFDCGTIRFIKKDQTYRYDVRSLSDLYRTIIPHFKEYPLLTQKFKDFEKFNLIIDMMIENKHLSNKWIQDILDIAYSMNPSGKRKYSKEILEKVVKSFTL